MFTTGSICEKGRKVCKLNFIIKETTVFHPIVVSRLDVVLFGKLSQLEL